MIVLLYAITLLRIPLAFLFAIDNPSLRFTLVCLAMISDVVDGFIARRYHLTSKIGAILDPLTDKFFSIYVLCILFIEKKIGLTGIFCMLSRDAAILLYSLTILYRGEVKSQSFRSLAWGKITTTLQSFFFLALSLTLPIPTACYFIFLFIVPFVLVELFTHPKRSIE